MAQSALAPVASQEEIYRANVALGAILSAYSIRCFPNDDIDIKIKYHMDAEVIVEVAPNHLLYLSDGWMMSTATIAVFGRSFQNLMATIHRHLAKLGKFQKNRILAQGLHTYGAFHRSSKEVDG